MMGADVFRHESLAVWNASVELAASVYDVTNTFPVDERFGLVSQLRRASISISSNIAGGNGRSSARDRIRFTEIAYGSLLEVSSQLAVARRLNFVTLDTHDDLRLQLAEIARMLTGLRTHDETRVAQSNDRPRH